MPIIGCRCSVCRSKDPRDKRLRASVLVEYGGLNILVDAGPDFRTQMLAQGVSHLDAILLTHNHKDHTGGLDDVRSLNYIDKRAAEIYCEKNVLEELIREYPYVFSFPKYPGAPEWELNVIDEKPFLVHPNADDKELVWVHDVGYHHKLADGRLIPTANCLEDMVRKADEYVCGPDSCLSELDPDEGTDTIQSAEGVKKGSDGSSAVGVIPVRGLHSKLPVLGFRIGDIAYLTDMCSIPEGEFEKLRGLKHLTLNTVGYHKHHSHFSLQETLEIADRIGAQNTWLTHLSHSFPSYEVFCKELEDLCAAQHIRSIVRPAYDGLTID